MDDPPSFAPGASRKVERVIGLGFVNRAPALASRAAARAVTTAAAGQGQLSVHRRGLFFGQLDGAGRVRGKRRKLLGRQAPAIGGVFPSADDIKT